MRTERLLLRRFDPDDVDELAVVFAKAEVWQFPYGRGLDREETAAFVDSTISEWDQSGFGLWAAVELGSGRLTGFVGLSVPHFLPEVLPAVEVGWRLDPGVWGRGFATEGARAALTEAFTTLGLAEVYAIPETTNASSVRLAERLGMGLARSVTIPANERRGALDALLYRITREEWAEG